MHDRLDVADVPSVILVGVSVQLIPVEGDTESVRATVPANPCRDVMVRVELPEAPASTVELLGLAATVKS